MRDRDSGGPVRSRLPRALPQTHQVGEPHYPVRDRTLHRSKLHADPAKEFGAASTRRVGRLCPQRYIGQRPSFRRIAGRRESDLVVSYK